MSSSVLLSISWYGIFTIPCLDLTLNSYPQEPISLSLERRILVLNWTRLLPFGYDLKLSVSSFRNSETLSGLVRFRWWMIFNLHHWVKLYFNWGTTSNKSTSCTTQGTYHKFLFERKGIKWRWRNIQWWYTWK